MGFQDFGDFEQCYYYKHFLCEHKFTSLGEILGYTEDDMFNFLRNCQTVFHSGCITVQTHQQCIPVSVCTSTQRHIDQWNTIESPKINLHILSQVIFNKRAKDTQWEKGSPLNGKTGYPHAEE